MLPEILAREFLAAQGAQGRALTPDETTALQEVLRRAQEAEPSVELEPRTFVRYVGERCRGVTDLPEHLSKLHAGDLWLACGCANGDEPAQARFRERFELDLETAIARAEHPDLDLDLLRERLLGTIFSASGEALPRVVEYRGQGSLRGWFRIAIVRHVMTMTRGS